MHIVGLGLGTCSGPKHYRTLLLLCALAFYGILNLGGASMYLPREEGQGLVEYALILVLVAIVVIAILALLGPQIANIFSRVTSGLDGT
jgi:pilus assembly protein Flp/PilA